jgi:protein SCO1/2
MGYVIDHSTGAYVFDPAGRLRLYVKDASSIAEIAADIRLLLQGR